MRLSGRTDDILTIRGVNVFPSPVAHVLMKIEGVDTHYRLIVDRVGVLDILEVQVEVNERIFSDEVKKPERPGRKRHSCVVP